MIRARTCPAAASFLLGAIVLAVISSAAFSQDLPTNWEARYLNLRDNIRALAIDPLDPEIVFIGTDREVVGSLDGGETWNVGESFRTASFSVTAAVSPEALELLLMIEEEEETDVREDDFDIEVPGLEREDLDEALLEIETRLADPERELATLLEREGGLEAELRQAEEEAAQAEAARAAAASAAEEWEADPVSISQVAGMSLEDTYGEDRDNYDQLGDWLSERGLSVPADAEDRRDTLLGYLEERQAEGVQLEASLAEAAGEATEADTRVGQLEDQLAELDSEIAEAEARIAELEEAAEEAEEVLAEEVDLEAEEPVFAEEEEELVDIDVEATGVNYLAFDPAASEKIYLAAFDGVYKSEDTGSSWTRIYTGPNPPQSAVLTVTVDPSNPDALFAGTLSGIARSDDGGESWTRPSGRIANMVITRIAVHPFDSRIVLAGTAGDGIFKSTDGGERWTQVFTRAVAGANRVLSIEFAPSQPEIIYTGTMSGIYKSLDGGESWDLATGMGISPSIQVRDLVVSPINPELVVIASGRGVFGTLNGGGSWRRLAFGTMFENSKLLAFDPLNPQTVWMITGSRVFQNVAPRFLDLSDGEELELTGSCEFTLDGLARHQLTIDEIDEETGEAVITIRSDPRKVRLGLGETTAVDLTGDGQDDLLLTLESLEDGVPSFRVVRIAPVVEEVDVDVDVLPPIDQITGLEDLEPYFRAEPTWVEVQQAAGRWAEVHPEKIASWRSGAAFRALLPRVNLDYREQTRRREDADFSEQYSYTYQYSDRRRSSFDTQVDERQEFRTQYRILVADTYFQFDRSDREQVRDRDRDWWEDRVLERERRRNQYTDFLQLRDDQQWGVSLRWDLGDLLYCRDRLRISTEARRLVELRQDVVEQVTLYYFDRRTARIDMILNPPADPYSRVEMLLQIQQLDASLDAMTGGYFTQTIKDREARLRR